MPSLQKGFFEFGHKNERIFDRFKQKIHNLIQENNLESLDGYVVEISKRDMELYEKFEYPHSYKRLMNGYKYHGLTIKIVDKGEGEEYNLYKLEQ